MSCVSRARVRIGPCDLDRVAHQLSDRSGEPGCQTALEGNRCNDGDEDRRQHRNEAEQPDDANVQPGRSCARAALAHELLALPGHDADEEDDENAVDREDADDNLVHRKNWRQAGENEKGDERRDEGGADCDRPQPAQTAGGRTDRSPTL
jgi:hypothetical protein